jgi:peroxisomal coenzyme A diphosphatase NUDT7
MNLEDIHNLQGKLPKTVEINGRDEYFNSVVLLLLIPVNGEYHIVLEKRAGNIRQGGEISLPGGKREPDEPIETTALRETVEEIGLCPEDIKIVGRLDTVIAPLGVIVDVFVGVTEVSFDQLKPNPSEVEKLFTVPVSFFKQTVPEEYEVMVKVHPSFINEETGKEEVLFPSTELNIPPKYRTPWGKLHNKIYVYKTEGEVIWGITARVIKDFTSRIA